MVSTQIERYTRVPANGRFLAQLPPSRLFVRWFLGTCRDCPHFGTQLAQSPTPCSVRRGQVFSMADTTIITEPASELESAPAMVLGTSRPPHPILAVPSSQQGSIWLNRRASRSGQIILDTCPADRTSDDCEGCHLRALCKCAYTDFLASAATEQRVWIVLALSGAVTILYAVWCFFGGR